MKSKKKFALFLVLLVSAIFLAAYKIFGPATSVPDEKYFFIKTGSSYQQVKTSLLTKKIISSDFIFNILSKWTNYTNQVKPGRYEIKEGTSIFNLIRILKNGKQLPVRLVINKIRTKEDIAAFIGKRFECDSASVINFFNNNDSLKQFNLDTNTVVSAIIPNTYIYNWNVDFPKLFRRLFAEHNKFWNDKRQNEAAVIGLNPAQVYILASIVEEETIKEEDKPLIASVYLNRIKKGMKLAADPTVKFALRNFALKRVYEKHLAFDSPYNTYKYKGLPPGPICTPSITTIEACLQPAKTNYLYFVASATRPGYHDFSDTYKKHLKLANEYQKKLDSLNIH
ncbi:MAG TPA: endolytic transglycosylase MltG [Chitinophagaceae bacterium]|nr:endolytic transglycosylase MltG [Chitinophagaceae bacterium]